MYPLSTARSYSTICTLSIHDEIPLPLQDDMSPGWKILMFSSVKWISTSDKSTPPSLTDCVCIIMLSKDDLQHAQRSKVILFCAPVATQESIKNFPTAAKLPGPLCITEWVGLEVTSKIIQFQPLDQAPRCHPVYPRLLKKLFLALYKQCKYLQTVD